MKKVIGLLLIKSLLIGLLFVSCDEKSLQVPYYELARVSKIAKDSDSVSIHMKYNDRSISEYEVYIYDSLVSNSHVTYYPGRIVCEIDGIKYDIRLSNTSGGSRAETISAETPEGSRLYYVEYSYDDLGRLSQARLDGVGNSGYLHYKYEDNAIIIDDMGFRYVLELSSAENLDYACNVMLYTDAPLTSKYIVNPHLYYLNIYGAPIERLPSGYSVTRTADNRRLSSVGIYSYEY